METKPWLYFLVWLNSWWSLLMPYTGKALERGCLLMDWTGSVGKARNWNVRSFYICRESFSDFDEENLTFWKWGAQESMGFFPPFLPFLKLKGSCCVVRVVGHEIPGTGGDPSSQASPGSGTGLQLVSPFPAQLIWVINIRSRKFHVHTSILSELWETG